MTWFLLVGDMLVMAFMTALVAWISLRGRAEELDAAARLPLDDEDGDG